jgi:hypothetical protein
MTADQRFASLWRAAVRSIAKRAQRLVDIARWPEFCVLMRGGEPSFVRGCQIECADAET